MSKEPIGWITVKGNHIPIYDGESKSDALERFYVERRQKVTVGDNDVKISQRRKRVDPVDVTDERIMSEIAGKDSYANSKEYRQLRDEITDASNKYQKINKEQEGLYKQLKKASSDKEKEEIQGSIDRLEGEKRYWSKKMDDANAEREGMDKDHALSEHAAYVRNMKPGDISSDVKDDYYGFSKKTTVPMIDRRIKSGEVSIAEMSPKTYLQECAFSIFKDYGATLETQLYSTPADNVRDLMEKIESGVKLDLPYLDYESGNQEGRNRAVAAYLLGIEKIPVAIIKRRR